MLTIIWCDAGPKFGTNVGRGLAVGSMVKTPPAPQVIQCPKRLEMRQIIQYKPVDSAHRHQYVYMRHKI